MKRDSIDFHEVAAKHEEIHARLVAWAAWVKPTGRQECSPMFRSVKSGDQWEPAQPRRTHEIQKCRNIERGIQVIATGDRPKMARALRWSYITKRSPVMACRSIGCTLVELAELVDAGRQELIDIRVDDPKWQRIIAT
jgi:hypothetical protein